MGRFCWLVVLLSLVACSSGSPREAALVLKDPYWDKVHVQAVVTSNADCSSRGHGYVATENFVMAKGVTHKVVAPNGEDICWRHDRDPNHPSPGAWSGWSRATMFPGQTAETDL